MTEEQWYFEHCPTCVDAFKYSRQKKRKYLQGWDKKTGRRILILQCSNCFEYHKNPFQGDTYDNLKKLMIETQEQLFTATYGKGLELEDLRSCLTLQQERKLKAGTSVVLPVLK